MPICFLTHITFDGRQPFFFSFHTFTRQVGDDRSTPKATNTRYHTPLVTWYFLTNVHSFSFFFFLINVSFFCLQFNSIHISNSIHFLKFFVIFIRFLLNLISKSCSFYFNQRVKNLRLKLDINLPLKQFKKKTHKTSLN